MDLQLRKKKSHPMLAFKYECSNLVFKHKKGNTLPPLTHKDTDTMQKEAVEREKKTQTIKPSRTVQNATQGEGERN